MKALYTAEALASGDGRDGQARSSDGKLQVSLATPVEMGGSGEGTNPEQLFAAGYGACFHSALRVVARRQKVDVSGSTVAARVSIAANGQGGYGLAAQMNISLPTVDAATAQALVEAAHRVCPYSNATRGNIDVELKVTEVAA